MILARRPHVDRAYLFCCLFLNFILPQSIIVVKYALVPAFAVMTCFTCYRVMDKVRDLPA